MIVDVTLQRFASVTKTVDITEEQYALLQKVDPAHPFDDALPFLNEMADEMDDEVDYNT